MNNSFDFPLSEFEQITANQLALEYFDPKKMDSPVVTNSIKGHARELCLKWNGYRVKRCLPAWK